MSTIIDDSVTNKVVPPNQPTIGNEKLNCDSIMLVVNSLRVQYPDIGGLIDVALFNRNEILELDLNINNKTVFLILVNNHWVTLTNIINSGDWLMFDSLNSLTYLRQLKHVFKRISKLENKKGRFLAYTVKVPRQKGVVDGGLFALAYAIELCQNKNPAELIFDQTKMRNHFNNCVKAGEFTNFPSCKNSAELSYQEHYLNLGTK